jgi:hypothetical protein
MGINYVWEPGKARVEQEEDYKSVPLLGYYTAQICSWLPTFRNNVSAPSSTVEQFEKHFALEFF